MFVSCFQNRRKPCDSLHVQFLTKSRLTTLFPSLIARRMGGGSGSAMVLGKLPVPGRPTIWITVEQGPTALVVGAGGGCLDIFTLIYPFSPLSPSLWETARYRLKYCLKGSLNPKQPTNQPTNHARRMGVHHTQWLVQHIAG